MQGCVLTTRRLLAVVFLLAFFIYGCDADQLDGLDGTAQSVRTDVIDLVESFPPFAQAAPQAPDATSTSSPLAQVGQLSITDGAVAYRIGIGRAYGNELSQATALVGLVNAGLEAEVGRMVGVSASADELDAFSAGVKKNSKAPAVLAAVRQVFGTDVASYRQLYLAPKIMNRKLRTWFSRNETMHQQQRASMQQAWTLVQAGGDFEDVAKATGLHFSQQDYGKKKATTPDAFKAYFPAGMAGMSAGFKTLLTDTEPGDIVASIAENDHSYRIVRLLSKQGEEYSTEEMSLAKASFDDWYQEQMKNIHIEIVDDSLKQSIQDQYSNIAWVKGL